MVLPRLDNPPIQQFIETCSIQWNNTYLLVYLIIYFFLFSDFSGIATDCCLHPPRWNWQDFTLTQFFQKELRKTWFIESDSKYEFISKYRVKKKDIVIVLIMRYTSIIKPHAWDKRNIGTNVGCMEEKLSLDGKIQGYRTYCLCGCLPSLF